MRNDVRHDMWDSVSQKSLITLDDTATTQLAYVSQPVYPILLRKLTLLHQVLQISRGINIFTGHGSEGIARS